MELTLLLLGRLSVMSCAMLRNDIGKGWEGSGGALINCDSNSKGPSKITLGTFLFLEN